MNAMHSCSLALFLDLCYGLMKTWKSYDPPEATVIPKSFYSGIIELFENVERKFGHTLVSHAVRYVIHLCIMCFITNNIYLITSIFQSLYYVTSKS